MAKGTGLASKMFVSGYDISGDVGAINEIASPKPTIDVTGIDSAGGHERIQTHSDGRISFNAFFNDATGQEHDVLKAKAAVEYLLVLIGSTKGNPAAMLVALQTNYDWDRPADGSLIATVQALSSGNVAGTINNVGLEWGTDIIGGTDTLTSPAGAGDQTVGEVTAQTTAGAAIMLQVISLGSGTPTFIVQDSSDTTTGSDGSWATLKTMTIQAANTAERLTVSGTVEKGLRVNSTGTFTNAVIACGVRRGLAVDTFAYTGSQA